MFGKIVLSMVLMMSAQSAFAASAKDAGKAEGRDDAAKAAEAANVGDAQVGLIEDSQRINEIIAASQNSANPADKAMASVLANPSAKLGGDANAIARANQVGLTQHKYMTEGKNGTVLTADEARRNALKDVLGRDVTDKELEEACKD